VTSEGRYSRQELLFGDKGQRRIQQQRAAIVGLGGLGSHVAQQLAYLGVLTYVLVDGDIVTISSLNRVIGAVEADVTLLRPKVEVAARMIGAVQAGAKIQSIPQYLEGEQARRAIPATDIVFGCLDDDTARLQLLDLCASSGRPYLDLSTDTGEGSGRPWYGGRVMFSFVGRGCLSCRQLVDQRVLARATMTPEQQTEDDRLYGVATSGLGGTGPSVISLNGTVASLGVTEFMAWATRLRDPWPHLTYRGDLGRVTLNQDEPMPDCYYCVSSRRQDQQVS
jgi:molybdopterin/thiamine biosynthesis adenylyltransferase